MCATIRKLRCQKCGHEWLPRKFGRPQWCPQCNSPDWDEPRKRPPIAEQRANARQRRIEEAKRLLADTPLQIAPAVIVPATVQVPFLDNPPAGPWKEAINQAETMGLTDEMAKTLSFKPGDVMVSVHGESMEAAGIPDGSQLLMRPLNGKKPPWGAVVLVQAVTPEGQYLSTIKHWYTTPAGGPDLRDGRNMPFYLPTGVEQVTPVAVMVGLIAQRSFSYREEL
ncbi:MAG: hypothetical protein JOZ57_03065 [Abitibacteriaceae bacterium]|nr:hypothetical protein [Abditibacteriaceae bacterium]